MPVVPSDDRMARAKGDGAASPGTDCADVATKCLYREPPGGRARMKRKPPAVRSIGIDFL